MEELGTSSTAEPSATPSTTESLIEPSKMKIIYFSNEFPHDDLKDLLRCLYGHSKDARHPSLATFIRGTTRAVREEIRSLPGALRSLFPAFETIFDLADYSELRSGPLGACVDGMLLCAVQLATLIGHYEDTSEDEYDFHKTDACLAGLGTGLLATAAVAISPTLADLPLSGAEVIRVAFRLGVQVNEVSRNLQPQHNDIGPGDSWAYVIPDAVAEEVQSELDAIHAADKTPEPSKIFISALSRTSVTVSGPPARLKHIFLVSDFFRDRRSIALPVYGGLCHANHIYSRAHVDAIIPGNSLDELDARFSLGVPVFSTSSGAPFPAKTARGLFRNIVEELLTQRIQWDKVVQGVLDRAMTAEISECVVHTIRNSLQIRDLVETLNAKSRQFDTKTRDLIPWITKPNSHPKGPITSRQSKIAIVGMSCRMPGGATDTEKFWEVLNQGLDVHRKVPADRFDVDTHCDPNGKRMNTSLTPYGCFIDEPGLFDAPFFNMSPREALQTDPMQRLAIVTAYEALERAGYVANRTASTNLHRIGTFYGQASDDYREVNTAQEVGTYFITGGCRAFGPGRINYFFKFSGPSYSIDTACSSGLATIHIACNSLWQGDTDTAVAGGMNVLTNSDAFAGLSNGHFLSKTPNACKTWDCEADGYCRSDGVVSIILKRLEDAEADNDNILGVILAAGTNHSADAISITHPHAGHQADLTRQILRQAAVDPLDVSYVEMHGTGTQAGDAQEIQSVGNVFAPIAAARRRSPKQPLHIGAVKSNVGHGEAVAGSTALLKVLLMFEKEAIPPHVGIKNSINPGFPTDLDKRNLHIPFERTAWPRLPERKRIAVVNNFSAAGGNSSIVIEEGPTREIDSSIRDPRLAHVIAISAKSKVSLKGNLERMINYLDAHTNISLHNLAYTTTARRYHHNHRVAIATSDVGNLRNQLASYLPKVETHKPVPPTGPPPVIFAFTGQGASHRSMNLELFRDSPCFRQQILLLDSLAQAQGFPSFIPAVNDDHPKDHMHPPTITQLALVCTEMALAKLWESLGVRPDVVIGHSLGEYAALHIAGVLSAADVIFLVGQRARLLEEKCRIGSHKMLAVRASLDDICAKANSKPFEVACVNGPKDTVLSGTGDEIRDLIDELQGRAGFRCIALDVAFAFHSSQTDPILDDFEQTAKKGVLFQPPTLPIISPLLGKVIFDETTVNANYLRRATREPVNFLGAVEAAYSMSTVDETMVWLEIGPHPVCLGFARSILPRNGINAAAASLRRDENNWQTLSGSLAAVHAAGLQVDWNEFHRPFENALQLLDLPTYAWNDKTYWIQYQGDWALTKGNTFYDKEKAAAATASPGSIMSSASTYSKLRTSLVHRIIEETISGSSGRVTVQSDMMEADFLKAAWGHQMNGAGVVTSSIHADIALTLGKYLVEQLKPKGISDNSVADMNIVDLVVREGLVAQKNTKVPQLIQVSIATTDISTGVAHLEWHSVTNDGCSLVDDEPIITARIIYGNSEDWLSSWSPTLHFVQSRIEALSRLADEGVANRLSHKMAYMLFAKNLVDYADKYRGMQSVVMHGLEAYAEVTIKASDMSGVWTVPPFFIDSVCHLGGFVMNVSDALDTKNNFCVTPGWGSLRLARPLVAGGKYRSYVKMIPTAQDASVYLGDVYILREDEIIGVMQAMKFRSYPRVLLNRFFSPADVKNPATGHVAAAGGGPVRPEASVPAVASHPAAAQDANSKPEDTTEPGLVPTAPTMPPGATDSQPEPVKTMPKPTTAVAATADSVAAKAMALVASEAGLELSDLQDEVGFGELGIDSLMSLVIAEKLREQLNVTVSGSLFLEYPTVGDLRAWLVEYYG